MEQKTPFKELSLGQKFQYIWDYYKIPLIASVIIIAVVVSFIQEKATQKNTVLNLLCINSKLSTGSIDTNQLFPNLLENNGYDTSKYEISINTNMSINVDNNGLNYQNMAVLAAHFSAHDYNICFMDDDTFEYYAKEMTFRDLSDYLDTDILDKYADYITYATDNAGSKYPCGIRLSSNSNKWLSDSGLYDSCTFGICYSDDDNKELVQKASDYILK